MNKENIFYSVKLILFGMILMAVIFAGIKLWSAAQPNLPSALAPPSADISKVEKELLACKNISAYKPIAKRKVDLPDTVKADPKKHLVAATKIQSADYPQTISAVYDEDNGAIQMFVRKDPLPWLIAKNKYELGVKYGWSDVSKDFRFGVDGRAEFYQVKALHLGIGGSLYSDGNKSIDGRVWYSW